MYRTNCLLTVMLSRTWGPRTRTRTCKLVLNDPRGQGLSSRKTTLARFPFKRNRLRCVRCVTQAPANRNARSKQWQPWLAACQRKRLRFLRFSFTFEWKPGFMLTKSVAELKTPSLFTDISTDQSISQSLKKYSTCVKSKNWQVTTRHKLSSYFLNKENN